MASEHPDLGTRLLAPVHRFDAFQQRHRLLAVPVAVWRKLSDKKGGYLAALLTFYAFVSIFPLLLVLTTILDIVLKNYPKLQEDILNSALVDFPVIGDHIKGSLHGYHGSGVGLWIGALATVVGAFGLVNAIQDVVNTIWDVPLAERPDFRKKWLHSFGLIAVLGLGVLSTTVISGIGEWAGGTEFGSGVRWLLLGASLVATILLFWLVMRLAAAKPVRTRDLFLTAVLGGIILQGMQWLGGAVAAHQLRHASNLYGTFGLVLGLIAWLYLQARLILLAVSCDVVRVGRAWPRSLFDQPDKSSQTLV